MGKRKSSEMSDSMDGNIIYIYFICTDIFPPLRIHFVCFLLTYKNEEKHFLFFLLSIKIHENNVSSFQGNSSYVVLVSKCVSFIMHHWHVFNISSITWALTTCGLRWNWWMSCYHKLFLTNKHGALNVLKQKTSFAGGLRALNTNFDK
jgi:hypothetical protein